MDWSQIGTWLGISGGTMAVVGPIVKWLVSDWFKKQRELQDIRHMNTKNALAELKRVTDDITAQLRVTDKSMFEMKIRLENIVNDYGEIVRKMDKTCLKHEQLVQENTKHLTERVDKLQTLVIQLGKDVVLVRGRNVEKP